MPYFFFIIKFKAAIAYAVFSTLLLVSNQPVPVPLTPIVLHPPTLLLTPKEFFIAEIVDERPEKSAVAWVFPPVKTKQKPVLQKVDLQGGGLNAIQNYVWQSMPRDKKLRPILIRLKECKITETQTAPGRIEGKVAFSLSFDLKAGEEQTYLTDYRIDTKYTRPDNQLNIVEPVLRESINSALKYFNNWMNSQADRNPKLAREVKVLFKDYSEKQEGDTIYYAANRPLKWDDFQEKPRNSKYAGSVFPSFGFEEQQEITNGVIKLQFSLKVYVPKSACWVKDNSRDDYTLNHEQRHFDIVEIVAKRFEQKIRSTKLPVNNFDGLINFEFYEFFGEMNSLQEQYDTETQHGINSGQQAQWNRRIDQDLVALGVKNNS